MRLLTRRMTTLLATGALASLMATSAMAAGTVDVSQSVTGGTRTASLAASTPLSAVTYSHASQTSAGQLTLTVDDATGTGDGWNVTVQSGAFSYSDGDAGTTDDSTYNIAASNFALSSVANPEATAGQAIDGTGGPTAGVTGTLEVARKVISANAGFGQGTYTQGLGVALTVPGQARAGTYTGTVTTTITAGP